MCALAEYPIIDGVDYTLPLLTSTVQWPRVPMSSDMDPEFDLELDDSEIDDLLVCV